ncbi:hypothetical protein HUB98_24160 [Paenibacillus barcinonensis]|uniref:CN hydrolase domain-containing protein n=1 Tax=Paenibacillus barcinonensis TaxID=198119 RepID=A0A2V4V032_PAEBA|nr:hypothetical protein [Paenibacillus barcinonensis]PYE42096.1 hypothetical protein DFQ00_1451 [Paenibacillus barcinonensis]QKS58997.1 hypothetical protein HUB98_24160 [Paenibacillus barcinonensis]
MQILIGQPQLESGLKQLETDIRNNQDLIDLVIYPEGYLNQNVEEACLLAQAYKVTIISGHKKPKDRAIIISRSGEIKLDRAKYDSSPIVEVEEVHIGFILCDELVLQGQGKVQGKELDLIVHPIGVGMFSEEQFEEWIKEAKKIAVQSKSMVIGTSHANGAFKNSEISIPIAYCIDQNGQEKFILKNDTRTIIYDTQADTIKYA